jgi:phospholipase D1/2
MSSRSGPVDSLVYSHHQKFLVTDFKTKSGKSGIRAFIGGLDLTKGRFDHHDHPVGPAPNAGMEPEHEPKIPGDAKTWAYAQKWSLGDWQVDEWYNLETNGDRRLPRQPWHDVHARLDGPSAWDYLREFVGRWLSKEGAARSESPIWKTYLSLLDQDKFVPIDQPYEGGTWCVQVCRSLEKAHWSVAMPRQTLEALKKQHHWSDAYGFQWPLGAAKCEQSILQAYDQAIDQAEEFIYIENQYLLGSGDKWGAPEIKNDIPVRIVNRILERAAAKVPFHVYIVMPMFPEGEPASDPMRKLRRFEYETFKWMVGELDKTMGEKWSDYLSLYFLANWQQVLPSARWTPISNSADQNRFYALKYHQRYMIYVHTKMMIVDDRYLILGSCNLNDRGLMGNGDSEIVISAWPMLDAKKRDTCIKDIRKLRLDLWKEHLAPSSLPAMHLQPGDPSCVKDIKTRAFKNHKAFREMTRGPGDGHLCLWNYKLVRGDLVLVEANTNVGVNSKWKSPEEVMCLPDSPFPTDKQARDEGWTWRGDSSWVPSFIVD